MELKWTRAGGFAVGPARSNRTFMELKFHWNQDRAYRWYVF